MMGSGTEELFVFQGIILTGNTCLQVKVVLNDFNTMHGHLLPHRNMQVFCPVQTFKHN